MVAGSFHPVGVVPGSLDHPGVGPVAARRVEALLRGDLGPDPGGRLVVAVQGEKAGSAARRRMMRTVRLNLTRSGSMSASVAAWQIRALIA